MSCRNESTRNAKVDTRMREIRATWSADERKRRAETGRRRVREFMQLIEIESGDPSDLWAVGAATWDDLQRLQH